MSQDSGFEMNMWGYPRDYRSKRTLAAPLIEIGWEFRKMILTLLGYRDALGIIRPDLTCTTSERTGSSLAWFSS
jgi:hypothetical protein